MKLRGVSQKIADRVRLRAAIRRFFRWTSGSNERCNGCFPETQTHGQRLRHFADTHFGPTPASRSNTFSTTPAFT